MDTMKIDTKKPVYFYDDRGKDKSLVKLGEILYEDFHNCLCRINYSSEIVLFDKADGKVYTTNYEFWYATNELPVSVKEENGEISWVFDGFNGDWFFERSSGYAGYRCRKCSTWIHEYEPKKCNCVK